MRSLMRSLIVALAVIAAVAVFDRPAAAVAQEIKVATVNLQYILTSSQVAHVAQGKLKAKRDELEGKLKKEQDKFQSLQSEIEKKRSVWTEEVLQEKLRELQKMEDFGKIMTRDASQEMQDLERKVMEPILKELHEVIAEVGQRDGYTFIFDNTLKGLKSRTGLLYAADSIDISDSVLKELDARMAGK